MFCSRDVVFQEAIFPFKDKITPTMNSSVPPISNAFFLEDDFLKHIHHPSTAPAPPSIPSFDSSSVPSYTSNLESPLVSSSVPSHVHHYDIPSPIHNSIPTSPHMPRKSTKQINQPKWLKDFVVQTHKASLASSNLA